MRENAGPRKPAFWHLLRNGTKASECIIDYTDAVVQSLPENQDLKIFEKACCCSYTGILKTTTNLPHYEFRNFIYHH